MGKIKHTFLDAAAALGNGNELLIIQGYDLLHIEVTGTGTNTIAFEAKFIDGGAYYAVQGLELPALTAATTTSTKGKVYQVDLKGMIAFRCRVSAYTDGSITAIGRVVSN